MATMIQAIRMALHVGESRLGVTDIFGEDVGPPLGGVFTGTQGLLTAWNSPLDERGIVGVDAQPGPARAGVGTNQAGQHDQHHDGEQASNEHVACVGAPHVRRSRVHDVSIHQSTAMRSHTATRSVLE